MIFYKQQEQYVITTVKELKYSGENAGMQCVTMLLTAVINHHIEYINFCTSTLNNIRTIKNNVYMYISIRCSVQTNDYLPLTDVPCILSIYNKVYTLE